MPLHVHVGPPASGKTTALLELATNTSSPHHTTWWIGLPHQRERTQHRLANTLAREHETRVHPRLEYLTLQQLLYRLIETSDHVPAPLASPGLQLAHTAIATQRAHQHPPTPGEAHLYLHAIRDAKRANLTPDTLPNTPHARDLARVWREYDRTRHGWADYEDYRQTLHAILNEPNPITNDLTLIIDGFLEHQSADLRLIHALAQHTTTHLTLERDHPTLERLTTTTYTPHAPHHRTRHEHQHPNPIEETRWVLRAIKRDLHHGTPQHQIAIIAPPDQHPTILAFAPHYGIPLRPNRPPTLADTRAGRLLQRLLNCTHDLTSDALRAIPNLAPLARAMSEHNLHGTHAAERLARDLNLQHELQHWRERLTPPTTQHAAPAFITHALDTIERLDPDLTRDPSWPELREHLKLRGNEASNVDLTRLHTWWPLLLQQYPDPRERERGIDLLEPDAATGLQYERAYLTHATSGAYEHASTEDYFISEDERVPRDVREHGLPKRISDRSERLAQHLQHRAQHLTITHHAADQSSPTNPDTRLTARAAPATPLPAGTPHETRRTTPPSTRDHRIRVPRDARPRIRDLHTLHDTRCGFRAHYAHALRTTTAPPTWLTLIGSLTSAQRITPSIHASLQRDHPTHTTWLQQHQHDLSTLALGVRLTHPSGATSLTHGVRLTSDGIELTRFTSPDTNIGTLHERISNDWENAYALHALARAFARPTHARAWPIGRDPIPLGRIDGRDPTHLPNTLNAYHAGDTRPQPGYHCGMCPIKPQCPAH